VRGRQRTRADMGVSVAGQLVQPPS
jgi:hypothetical protein